MKLVELLPKQVLMRIIGRVEKLDDNNFFLSRVIERTARGYSGEANPKYTRDMITVLGLDGRSKTCDDSECEEDANDRITR